MKSVMSHSQDQVRSGRITPTRTGMLRMLALALLLTTAFASVLKSPTMEAQAAAQTNETVVCFKYPNGTHYRSENVYLWRYHPSSDNYSLVESAKTNTYGCAFVTGSLGQSLKVVAGYSFTPAADNVTRCYFGSTPVFKAENVNRIDRVLSGPGYGTSSAECQNLFRWDG